MVLVVRVSFAMSLVSPAQHAQVSAPVGIRTSVACDSECSEWAADVVVAQ